MSSHDIRHRVEVYEEPGGSKPVKDDARALGNSNPITADHKVAAFDKMENPQYLHRHARHLQDGLSEWSIISSTGARSLFFPAAGRTLIIAPLAVKERRKLLPDDDTTALRRMTDWQERDTAPRGGKD